jgi:hypothetical protein
VSNLRAELVSALKKDFTTIVKRAMGDSVHLIAYQVRRAVFAAYISAIGSYRLHFLPHIAAEYSLLAIDALVFHESVTAWDLIQVPFRSAFDVGIGYLLHEQKPREWIRRTWPGLEARFSRSAVDAPNIESSCRVQRFMAPHLLPFATNSRAFGERSHSRRVSRTAFVSRTLKSFSFPVLFQLRK